MPDSHFNTFRCFVFYLNVNLLDDQFVSLELLVKYYLYFICLYLVLRQHEFIQFLITLKIHQQQIHKIIHDLILQFILVTMQQHFHYDVTQQVLSFITNFIAIVIQEYRNLQNQIQ